MTPQRWAELRQLVEDALAFHGPERLHFLEARTHGDAALLADAQRLLSYETQASGLFAIEQWQAAITPHFDITGTRVGNYRIVSEIGRGGMGSVYLAERGDGMYTQAVAIKVLQEGIFTGSLTSRFQQERQILATLQHPGIARLLDGGVLSDGRPYLVLEYVSGVPIDQWCDQQQLSVEQRLRLFLRVAEAVQSAHQQLVLHLDLKPANILVTAEGDARLLDFGIARILNDGDSRSGATLRLLTPHYASPEQAAGEALGVASDVFSLATLLYRLLTGALPYPVEDALPLEAARMLREVPAIRPSLAAPPARRAELAGDVDSILLKALRKEPERRYLTVAAFAEDIARHLASQPVEAHADSLGYRAGKFFRRNRIAVVASSLAACVLIISAIAVVRSAVVARRERAVAERRLKDMRALAHSYVFDLDPRLEELPGSVPIRAFVLQNAQKYLESMSSESVEDDELSQETAQGYSRIADVQGIFALPSLSNPAAAEASVMKALAIQRRLVERDPSDPKRRDSLILQMQQLATLFALNGDVARANAISQDAWTVGQPWRALHPTPLQFNDLAAIAWDLAWTNCGNGDLWNLADPATAIHWLDQSQQLIEQYLKEHQDTLSQRKAYAMLERIDMSRAAALAQLGRDAEAGPLYKDAMRLTTLTKQNLNEEVMRQQIRIYDALYLLSIHNVHGAEALAPKLMSPKYEDSAKNVALDEDEADVLSLLARIDLENGRTAQGHARLERAMDAFSLLYEKDRNEAGVSSEFAWNAFRLAEEPALDNATRTSLYQRALHIANTYGAGQPRVLSAAMLAGKCELGLARIAASHHNLTETHLRATAAATQLQKVLKAHPTQPEANRLLQQAQSLQNG